MNRRGAITDIILFAVIAFVTITFFALYAYGFNILTETLGAIPEFGTNISVGLISNQTFGQVNAAQNFWLPILSTVIILSMMLTIIMSNFLVRVHPAFFIVYLMVTVTAIIGGVYISNTYQELMTNEIFGPTLTTWYAPSFLMIWLPYLVAVMGILGSIVLFASVLRDPGAGGGI